MSWFGEKTTDDPHEYLCAFCNTFVCSEKGFTNEDYKEVIYICPNCDKPTWIRGRKQVPAPLLGHDIENLPTEIEKLYNEIRACTGAQAYTAAILACRKLLMSIAVQKGADEGKTFVEYVEHLSDIGYVPPDGKSWVDQIRKRGNEANHEIILMTKEDAEELISFVEMLLKFIYEFPGRIRK